MTAQIRDQKDFPQSPICKIVLVGNQVHSEVSTRGPADLNDPAQIFAYRDNLPSQGISLVSHYMVLFVVVVGLTSHPFTFHFSFLFSKKNSPFYTVKHVVNILMLSWQFWYLFFLESV